MAVTWKQEIWALALWVERTQGELGASFIAERIAHFEAEGSPHAVALWHRVARSYGQLGECSQPPD
jgi:hypothetical protein